jgi:hypothetical protein
MGMLLYNFVRRYFIVLLLLLLAGNFFVYKMMHKNSESIKNRHAPLGIISLEIATTKDQISNIVNAWYNTPVTHTGETLGPEHFVPHTALDVARRQTKIDFLFLLFYSLLLALLLIRLAPENSSEKWVRTAVLLSFATGLLDSVENIFMLGAMNWQPVAPWTIWLPSGAKWLVVSGLVITILYRLGKSIYRTLIHNNFRKRAQHKRKIV